MYVLPCIPFEDNGVHGPFSQKAQEAKAVSFERHYQLIQHKLALNAQLDAENDKLRQENETLAKANEATQEELRTIRVVPSLIWSLVLRSC